MTLSRFAGYLTYIYLVGASIFVFPGVGDSVRDPQWLWAAAGGALLGALHFCSSGISSWRNALKCLPWCFHFWLSYLLVRAIYSEDPVRALLILVFPLLVLFGGLGVFNSSFSFHRKWILGSILVVTLIQVLFGILQLLGMDPIFRRALTQTENLPAGFLGQHMFFGLLMAWLAFFWLLNRRWPLFVLCGLMVYLTHSSFAVASLTVGILWAWFCHGYRKSACALGAVLLTAGFTLFLYADGRFYFLNDNDRLKIWAMSLSAIGERPLLGYGIGAFSREFPAYHQGYSFIRFEEAHNEWIEYIFNAGFAGALALLPLIFYIGKALYKLPGSPEKEFAVGTLLIIGVNSAGSFPLQLAPFASLVIFALAWLLRAEGELTRAG